MNVDPNLNHRILIIDDNQAIHDDFRKILGRKNKPDLFAAAEAEMFGEEAPRIVLPEFQIDSAFQGREGFDLIEKSLVENRPYAMAFVDVRMPPGWDGVETTAQIWRKYPNLQVVLCTAYSDYSWEDMLRKLGYSDRLVILKKPFDNIEVLQLAISMTEKWRLYYQARLRLDDLENMVRDRTQQIEKANRELVTANEMLEIATDKARKMAEAALLSSQAKSEFLANMSHEIRTPMNGVIGMINLLLDTPLTRDQQTMASTIKFSAESLLSILNDILDFSKIEAGKMRIESTAFDLLDTVGKTVELFDLQARGKGLTLDWAVAGGVSTRLVGDPARLRQVLLNLLGNAVKFTEKGGVHLEIAQTEDINGGVVLRFSVRDTGIGISEAAQKKLFQSFTQADSSTTRKFGGTGLGLAICRRLVELMGGGIAVNSAPGGGTVFCFTLPFSRENSDGGWLAPAPAAPPAGGGKSKLSGLHILLVEDNKINQIVGVMQLKKLGCTVDLAGNGREAIEVWQRNKYDLILLDCQMPVMDGYDACRRIRARELADGLPPARIIAMTASVMPGDRNRCLEAGMDGYISKPVSIVELLAELENAVAQNHSFANVSQNVSP
jgi:signal transduction histidine kinase/AmiR/NasT family two-component response regulator